MKTIRLHGELGKKYGERHRFAVKSAAEAVRALCANFRGLDQHLIGHGPGFHVLCDSHDIVEDELHHPVSEEIQIIPVIAGAGAGGRGGLNIIIGAALVIAGGAITYFSGGSLAGLGTFLMKIGGCMIIGGVVQALTPVQKPPDPAERPENKPNYVFNGPVNTTAQGHPVPVGYGRLIVGGAVISANITVDDISPPAAPPIDEGAVYSIPTGYVGAH